MPLQATSGAASYDGFGGGAAAVPQYIEDVFSTYLFTGTGSNQTITNNIDLSTKGGLVWTKCRSTAQNNSLVDTVRGGDVTLVSETTAANDYGSGQGAQSFTSTGYVTGGFSARTYVSWTFRKAPKFFDVVTYTGTGSNTTIAHSLGAVPGSIIVKRTDTTAAWAVYHRSLANTQYLVLNTAAAAATGATWWNSTTPTSTVFSLGTDASVNASGGTYVAYLFAHDAGGFGLTGTDNVISCGSFTTDGSGNATVSLGWEPQFFMRKNIASGHWTAFDSMRAMPATVNKAAYLLWNASVAESADENGPLPTAVGASLTGFAASETYIYIAIRRGPMKVPTLGTSVFDISTVSTASGPVPGPTPTDMTLNKPSYNISANNWRANDRLRGGGLALFPNTTGLESSENYVYFDYQSGLRLNSWPVAAAIWYNLKRAPSFFDEVCYKGNGTNGRTITHNLSVTPELIIVKNRTTAGTDWPIRCSVALTTYKEAFLNLTNETNFWSYIQDQSSTTFTVGNDQLVNYSAGDNYVAYLFATCAGVSKVFSYTGNGSSQTINCGFTAGSRFVLIKRTDAAGDWYVWDSARGIVAGNDPHLSLNTTAAEVTTDDSVDTDNTGFIVNQVAATNVNVSSATYIGLAVA